MRYGFLVDADNCIGCRTCAVACKDANSYELGVGFRNVKAYSVGTYPDVRTYRVSYVDAEPKMSPKTGKECMCDFCAHIQAEGEQPACVASCPMRAIEYGVLEDLVAAHPHARIVDSFPALEKADLEQPFCKYIIKDVMLDEDFEEILI